MTYNQLVSALSNAGFRRGASVQRVMFTEANGLSLQYLGDGAWSLLFEGRLLNQFFSHQRVARWLAA
jgi:hypothetical protein